MLHFGTRLVGNAVAAGLRRLADSLFTQDASECGIADFDLLFFLQPFMDAFDPAVTFAVETSEQFEVEVRSCRIGPLAVVLAAG